MANNQQGNNEHDWNNFNWLRRACRGSTYTSYFQFSHLPYCSFDWGENGYAGCSNHGGELLYLSAPSRSKGLIMARGHFATSLYASLSRSQIDFGGPSTFGLEVSRCLHAYNPNGDSDAIKGSSFRLGSMIDRGCFNYRWPVNEYYLDLHPNHSAVERDKKVRTKERGEDAPNGASQGKYDTNKSENEDIEEKHVGTCQMFSCAKGNMFYQVLRIEEGGEFDMCFPPESQIVLTMGGPVWFQSFNDGDHELEGGIGRNRPTFRLSKDKLQDPGKNDDQKETVNDLSGPEPTETLKYWDKDKGGRGLEAKVYQLLDEKYIPLSMTRSKAEADNGTKFVEGRTSLTAYNAVVNLQDSRHPTDSPGAPRSATFLVAIRLFEGDDNDDDNDHQRWKIPTSRDLYNYVGVNPSELHATGAMWERIFLDRRTESESILDLAEFNMIGRTLEKILQVDIIPATFEDDLEGNESGNQKYGALVSNLFVRENIDLKALFWKIRYLIRIHKYLYHLRNPNETSKGGRVEEVQSIEIFQMDRIQTKVESVIRYLAKALLGPASQTPQTRMMPDQRVPGESDYYYVMMTIWYVWKYFKEYVKDVPGLKFDWTSQLSLLKTSTRSVTLFQPNRVPSDNLTFARRDRDKVHLLQWYHYGSLLKLCEDDVLPKSWKEDGLEQKVARLIKAAKVVSSTKLSSRDPYVADDEIFDRLSFVSDELGLDSTEPLDPEHNSAVELFTMRRVKQRDFTRSLNPGWMPRGEEASTSGPWEIHALCHHSRLMVLTKEEKSKQDWRAREHTHAEAEIFRQKISTFLNSEGTLIPCWERAHAEARRGWLRSEATAVVASTLVIILEKTTLAGSLASSVMTDIDTTSHNQKKLFQEVKHLGRLMKDQVEAFERFTNESGRPPPIQWELFRPPHKYHPVSFFNSLEDTPDLYTSKAIGKTSVPLSLRDQIDLPDALQRESKDFKKQDIDEVVPTKRLVLFDIRATGPDEDYEGFTWQIKKFKYDDSDKEESAERFSWALYDNLVDQEVQHRFLTVIPERKLGKLSTIPKDTLNLLVYVIHPESAVCLGNYALNFSTFSCRTGDTWVASITLRSWQVSEVSDTDLAELEKVDPSSDSSQNPFDGFRLPWNLRKFWHKSDVTEVSRNTMFKPEVSSIILSTNSFGDFSKCTVVSGLTGDEIIEEKMHSIVENARKLWQKFIHQPQTARCLVFLLLLGQFCQQITDHYEEAIGKLSYVLELASTFTNTEDEHQFELGVWSLDALHKLQNSLNATVASVSRAKEDLQAQILYGPGQRSAKLERMCQEYWGEFENNLAQLTAVNIMLDRKIELNTRNKDALFAVLTMRDSRTTISQNSTVQRLTYLTIGYLPIALMAAIFAIPREQNVLYSNMSRHGRSWFVGAIFIMSVATYTLAIYIGKVLGLFRSLSRFFRNRSIRCGRWKKPHSQNSRTEKPLNIWKWLCTVFDTIPHWLHQAFDRRKVSEAVPRDNDEIPRNNQKSMEEGKANGMSVENHSIGVPT